MTTNEETPRARYLAGKITFADFYRGVNKSAGVVVRDKALLQRCADAIARGDKHLNSIPRVCAMKQAARDAISEDPS